MEHITTRDAAEFVAAAPANVAASVTPQHMLMNRNALFQGGLRPHAFCLPILKREEHRVAVAAAATSGSSKFFLGTDSGGWGGVAVVVDKGVAAETVAVWHGSACMRCLRSQGLADWMAWLVVLQHMLLVMHRRMHPAHCNRVLHAAAPHPKHAKESACGCAGLFSAPVALALYAHAFEQADALQHLEAFASFNGPDFYGLPRNTDKVTLRRQPWAVPETYEFGESVVVPMWAGQQCPWSVV
jgi:dihydroorotase